MALPSQSSPSRNYTSPFSGVVLLSLSVTGLQNSRLNGVECTFSTIPTRVHLPGGVSFFIVYLRLYIGALQGHLLIVAHFYIFLTVFGTFLITDYLFCDFCLVVFFHE